MQNAEENEGANENSPLLPEPSEQESEESLPVAKKIRWYLDPGVFLLFFGWNLSSTVLANEILVQTCYVTFNFSYDDCILLGRRNESAEVKYIDDAIQPYVAKMLMVKLMLESILPAILILLLGPFADSFGRKPILNSTCFGLTLYFASLCCLSFLSKFYIISPWYYTLSIVFFALSGGFSCILTAVLSHTTDSSSEANRSERITIIELMIFIGVLLGTFTSSYLVSYLNTFQMFVTSFVCIVISTIYIVCFIEETVKITDENKNKNCCEKFQSMLSWKNFADLFRTCIKRRQNRKRGLLILLMTILMLAIFVLQGSSNVFYLFERKQFNWSIQDANLYDSASMVMSIVGTLGGLYVLKHLLGTPDIVIVIFSLLFKIASTTVVVLATKGWHMYLASGIAFIGSLYGSMCRSLISQMVDRNEIGKIFAVTTALEAISTLGAAPIYTYIYTNTYETFPSAFALVTIVALILNVIISLIVTYIQSKGRRAAQSPNQPIHR